MKTLMIALVLAVTSATTTVANETDAYLIGLVPEGETTPISWVRDCGACERTTYVSAVEAQNWADALNAENEVAARQPQATVYRKR